MKPFMSKTTRKSRFALYGALLAAIILSSAQVPAADAPAISGDLDGEPAQWYLDREGQESSATFIEQASSLEVDITGFMDAERPMLRDSLALRLRLDQTSTPAALEQASLVYFIGSDATGPVYRAQNEALEVTLERVERDGPWLELAGRLEGHLELEGAPGAQQEPVVLSADFALRARRIEF